MNTIRRRLSKLEAKLAPIVQPDYDGSAHEELLSRIEAIRSRMRPEALLPESGPFGDAQRERIQEWFRDWRSRETSECFAQG